MTIEKFAAPFSARTTKHSKNITLTQALVAFGIFATIALRNWGPLMYGAQYMMIIAVIFHLGRKQMKFHAGAYVAFYGLFALWCFLSTFWAHDSDRTISATIGVVHFILIGSAVAGYVIAERSPEFLLNCLAWSTLGLIVVLVASTPAQIWVDAMTQTADASSDANRLGYTVTYHPNALGRIMSVGAFIWVYKFRAIRNHRLLKLAAIVSLVAVLLLTKSRLSIILFVALVFFYLLFTSRHLVKFLITSLIAGAALGLTYWAMLNVPALYDAVGFRFVAMLGLDGTVDASTTTRAEMGDIAFTLFLKDPILGVGFNNYAYYYFNEFSGWAETYAHDNYAELLADVGLVGVVLYYAIPVWISLKLLLRLRSASRGGTIMLGAFLFLLSASQLAADFASISYTSDFVQLVTVLLFSWVVLFENERDSSQIELSEKSTQIGYSHVRT